MRIAALWRLTSFRRGDTTQASKGDKGVQIFKGMGYNLRGLKFGLQHPRLLALGLARFALMAVITIATAALVLLYHAAILDIVWSKPESTWLVWLWHLTSWLLSAVLVGVASILAFLLSQILFSVLIMDMMSRITEKLLVGHVQEPVKMPLVQQFFFLIRQEIPRAVIPMLLILFLSLMGWLTPLGPIITLLVSALAAVFLAWDNSDLVPARRMVPFSRRFRLLRNSLFFHLGFGALFLVPLLNILLLSFAPVGATMYYVEESSRLDGI
jgi:CysZ protein